MKTLYSLIVVTILSTFTASPVTASLGETLPQTIARYGPVLKQTPSEHLPAGEAAILYEFAKNGFRIQVRFVNGKAAWMLYLKDSGPIFDTEIRTFLENNAEGATWSAGTPVQDRFAKKKMGSGLL